jgi:hypothetical protein
MAAKTPLNQSVTTRYVENQWQQRLPYAEFSYNNSYQASIKMAQYEALYGQQCRTPLFWSQTRENQVSRPEMLRDGERQVQMIRENLRIAQSHQKSYADKWRRDLSFKVGDFVYLKISPMRGTRRFKVKGKLAPKYIDPFQILDHKWEVAYQLELPPQLSDVHDVFYISQVKKCLRVPEEQVPMEQLDLRGDLAYSEWPIKITEWVTRNKVIKMCKV